MASTVWKGHLTFGLLSLPVKLHSAARRESVGFNMLRKSDNSRVKQILVSQADDQPVPRREIVKGYEYEKDKYVVVDDAEIAKIEPKSARTVEVMEFVQAGEINSVFLDSSYYVAPSAAAGEKAYALLYKALRTSGYVGVARITMHGREHIVIVRPGEHGLVMHTMFYADEIRQVEEFRTDTSAVKDVELRMAIKLMASLRKAFEPAKYRDSYREKLMEMISERINMQNGGSECINMQRGGAAVGASVDDVNGARVRGRAAVVDIMTALKQSLSRNGGKSAGAGVESRSNVSRKPHTKAQRDARGGSMGIQTVGRASGARVGRRRAMGDPLLTDGGRGLAPRGSSRPAVGTPN